MHHRNVEPNILFLKGVKLSDLKTFDMMFLSKIQENLSNYNVEKPAQLASAEYSALPKSFININKWIKSTNLHCFYCDRQYKTCPVPIPSGETVFRSNREFEINIQGLCCNFPCVVAYLISSCQKKSDYDIKLNLLLDLYLLFTGTAIKIIKPSPSKYIMKKYIGNDRGITEDEYGDKIQETMNECLF